jgi:6-phosphogluconolactonase
VFERTIEVLSDAGGVAMRGAALIAERARTAAAERGAFTLALSGGRTPERMVELLSTEDVPWDAVTVFQVDERVAPPGHPDRNLTRIEAALSHARVVPMPVEDEDLEAAAARYAAQLPERLDLVHLGLGADGHTASLVPGDPVLEVRDHDVAVTGGYQGRRRMTLTHPAIDRAREALWLVTGADKADALARLLSGDRSIPAAHVLTARQIVLADEAAAATRLYS